MPTFHQHYALHNCIPPSLEARLAGTMTVGPRPWDEGPKPEGGPNRKQRRTEAALAHYFMARLSKYMVSHPDTPYEDAIKIVRGKHAR